MLDQLIAWLHTLTPAQGVALSISLCVVLAVAVIAAFLLWEWWEDAAAYKVTNIPQTKTRVVKGYPVEPWR